MWCEKIFFQDQAYSHRGSFSWAHEQLKELFTFFISAYHDEIPTEFSSSQDVNGCRSESQKLFLSFLFYLLDFVVAERLQLDASSCIEVDQLSSFSMSFSQSVAVSTIECQPRTIRSEIFYEINVYVNFLTG